MALSFVAVTHARGIVAAPGTSVGPVAGDGVTPAPIPDNCRTVRVTNPDGANAVLVGIAVIGTALVVGVNAQRVRAASTMDFEIGTISQRGGLDPGAGHGELGFVYDAIGGAITAEITYLNTIGEKV